MLTWTNALVIPAELARAGGARVEAGAADGGKLVATMALSETLPRQRMIEVVYTPPEPGGESYRPCRFPTFDEVYSALFHLSRSGIFNIQLSAYNGVPNPEGAPHASILMVQIGEIKEGGHGEAQKSN